MAAGTDVWQNRMVVLHEEEAARRDELLRSHGQQERQVARLWLKLQRYLTHQRAPWAPMTTLDRDQQEGSSLVRLSRWENGLRQRCRLKVVENGTRHQDASKARRSVAEADEAALDGRKEAPAAALLLPSGVALSKLCEGSDGEEWDEASARRQGGGGATVDGDGGLAPLTPRGDGLPAQHGAASDEPRRPAQVGFASDCFRVLLIASDCIGRAAPPRAGGVCMRPRHTAAHLRGHAAARGQPPRLPARLGRSRAPDRRGARQMGGASDCF